MHLDLHIHSTCSDGALAPAALAVAARRAGLGMIALADHDTVSGVAPAPRRVPIRIMARTISRIAQNGTLLLKLMSLKL